MLHITGFLSQNLPPSLDTIVPPTYVRQVRCPPAPKAAIMSLAATGTFSSSCLLHAHKMLGETHQGLSALPPVQAVALRETQLQTLVDDLDGFVHSSALASAAWLAQIDGLIFPHRYMTSACSVWKGQEHAMLKARQCHSCTHR